MRRKEQYRLKRWYPTLPEDWEEGMIVGYIGGAQMAPISPKYTQRRIYDNQVKKYPQFWEKIEEKDYKILSFKDIPNTGRSYISQGNGMYKNTDSPLLWTRYELLKDSEVEIYSVKRLSDNEVFTIGDSINIVHTNDRCFIESFEIKNNRFVVHTTWKKENPNGLPLKDISINNFIFTTHDGVPIYEGDTFWKNDGWLGVIKCIGGKNTPYVLNDRPFSTKEKAEEWIEHNKPRYSAKDIEQAFKDLRKYPLRDIYDHILIEQLNKKKYNENSK